MQRDRSRAKKKHGRGSDGRDVRDVEEIMAADEETNDAARGIAKELDDSDDEEGSQSSGDEMFETILEEEEVPIPRSLYYARHFLLSIQ